MRLAPDRMESQKMRDLPKPPSPIPEELFREVHRVLPIACVDVVVRRGTSVLLLRRKIKPMLGEWWFPGGRIRKGERAWETARRIVAEEAGLHITSVTQIGVDETFFADDPFGHPKNEGTHTINLIFQAQAVGSKITIDANHHSYKWELASDVDSRTQPYVRRWIGATL